MNFLRALIGLLLATMAGGEDTLDVTRYDITRGAVTDMFPLGMSRSDMIVLAALGAETPTISAELLVAISWYESNFHLDPNRVTGRKSKFCGTMQVRPSYVRLGWRGHDRILCSIWTRDPMIALVTGRMQIETILRDRRIAGDLRRALAYRACGESSLDGTCQKNTDAIVATLLSQERRLRESVRIRTSRSRQLVER